MREKKSRLYFIGVIFLSLFICAAISFFILAVSVFTVFGIGQCPKEGCRVSLWDNIKASFALLSPLLIFSLGAYFMRTAIYNLTQSKVLRIILLASFATFPILALGGLFVYAAHSKN